MVGNGIDPKFDDLVADIRAVRPVPPAELTERLDSLVAEGFPKEARSRSQRFSGESWRRILAPVATAAAALVLVFVGLNGLETGAPAIDGMAADTEVTLTASDAVTPESDGPDVEFFSPESEATLSSNAREGDAAVATSEPSRGGRSDYDETAEPATAEPLDRSLVDDEGRGSPDPWLPIGLIAAGVVLLIPALWFASAPLRRRYRERVLDW